MQQLKGYKHKKQKSTKLARNVRMVTVQIIRETELSLIHTQVARLALREQKSESFFKEAHEPTKTLSGLQNATTNHP